MKKAFYATTMLAGVSLLAWQPEAALAQSKAKKMSIGLSGSFKAAISFSEQEGSFESSSNSTARAGYDSFNIWTDSEVHFKGKTKLDNGVTVSVTVQLETDQATGATIDESYMSLVGAFGDVRIGSTKAASNKTSVESLSVGFLGVNNSDIADVIIKPGSSSAPDDTFLDTSDHMRLVYYSPRFSGFKIGASYRPSATNTNAVPATGGNAGTEVQQFDFTAEYKAKLGSADINADVGYLENHGPVASSNKGWRAGLSAGFGNVTVGGSYRKREAIDTGIAGTANDPELTVYDIGIAFEQGPWGVSAAYLHGEAPLATGTTGDDEVDIIELGASFNMGPGVDLMGSFMLGDWSDESTADGNNNEGWAVVGGVKVSF